MIEIVKTPATPLAAFALVATARASWPEFAMSLAQQAADQRCQDPYVQVGACALRQDNSVASIGYNGPPPGVDVDWSDRDARRKRMLHAEVNCLRYVRPYEAKVMAVTVIPCMACLSLMASWGIKEVYYKNEWTGTDPDIHVVAKEFGISLKKL